MARKPRDFDAELQALMEKQKKIKTQKTVQLGELVQLTGADTLPMEALAGALLTPRGGQQGALRHCREVDRTGPKLLSARGKWGKKATTGDAAQ